MNFDEFIIIPQSFCISDLLYRIFAVFIQGRRVIPAGIRYGYDRRQWLIRASVKNNPELLFDIPQEACFLPATGSGRSAGNVKEASRQFVLLIPVE